MNKKEIAEIKRTLKAENCCIDKVCACYVTPDKDKTIIPVSSFAALSDEETEQYLGIFKKSLSGSLGKQLNCLEFPLAAEKDGGGQQLLFKLKKNALSDDEKVEELFDKIIADFESDDYYCILIMHANYDVMTKSSDDADLDSDEVYSHIICSICPANLSKSALSYNQDENKLEDGKRAWIIEAPKCAFLFPTFTDRTTNIHEVLVYNKKASELNREIIEGILNCNMPTSADEQAEVFIEATQAAFENKVSYEQALAIQDSLYEQIESAGDGDSPVLSQSLIEHALNTSEAPNVEAFEETYSELLGNNEVFVENIVDKKKFVVKTDHITITANPSVKERISVKEVDGRKCIVIESDGNIEVNGISTV